MFKHIITRALTPVSAATAPFRPATSLLSSLTPSSPNYRRQYTTSSTKIQDLVFKTTEQLLKPPPDLQPAPSQEVLDALKARITLTANLKNDLGMDIFKTYQLIDKIEQELGGAVDISVEQVDKVITIQDVVNLVSSAQK